MIGLVGLVEKVQCVFPYVHLAGPAVMGGLTHAANLNVAKEHDSIENLFPAAIRAKGIMTTSLYCRAAPAIHRLFRNRSGGSE